MTKAKPRPTAPIGALLMVYLGLMHLAAPVAQWHLKRRLARGREDPARWQEKLGHAGLSRPKGPLIWLHAVGVGEVLALRGLITEMAHQRPDLQFLVTSSTLSSAVALARNPAHPNVMHQFLPLDATPFVARFLNHWRPDLAIWAEQDLWPGLVVATHRRAIPLALINARMNTRAFRARARFGAIFRDLFARFALLAAQDRITARHIAQLSPGARVQVTGSLKPACPALACDQATLDDLTHALAGRDLWCAAPTHSMDEAVVLTAHALHRKTVPNSLLILVPRAPERGGAIANACQAAGLPAIQRSAGGVPHAETAVWVADSFGELGLWYRLCQTVLIGGSFGPTGGHSPWEALRLGAAVLHGPNTDNFTQDYAALQAADGCVKVADAKCLAAALQRPDLAQIAQRGAQVQTHAAQNITQLSIDLLALMPGAQ